MGVESTHKPPYHACMHSCATWPHKNCTAGTTWLQDCTYLFTQWHGVKWLISIPGLITWRHSDVSRLHGPCSSSTLLWLIYSWYCTYGAHVTVSNPGEGPGIGNIIYGWRLQLKVVGMKRQNSRRGPPQNRSTCIILRAFASPARQLVEGHVTDRFVHRSTEHARSYRISSKNSAWK